MNEKELKRVIEQVHIKKEMQEQILRNLINTEDRKWYKDKEKKIQGWQKKAVIAAVALVTVGMGGFTVRAVVNNLVKERMDNMSEEEEKTIVEEMDSREEEADIYSRELTQKEKERKKELTIAYQKGQFPQEELKKVENVSQVDKNSLCYVPATGYMYLPKRELTDEELLQIIDYYEKVAYSLEERYKEEYQEEVQALESAEEKARQIVKAEGGINEEEAVAKAEEWLNKLFGKDKDGMKIEHYIVTEDYPVDAPDEKPFYMIIYSIEGVENYYFTIGSVDGTLWDVEYSSAEMLDAEEISLSDGKKKVQTLYVTAEDYLKNTFGISEDYAEVYYSYLKNDTGDGVYLNNMNFWFVKKDRMAHHIVFDCREMKITGYCIENYDKYWDGGTEHESVIVQLK